LNRGLLLKAMRELWAVTLGFALALFLIEAVLAYVLPTFSKQFSEQLVQMQFAQTTFKALLGTDIVKGGSVGPEMFVAIAWVHPVVMALVWAHAIIVCTRVPAGEVDRGTIDVLLGLPVSRWELYCSEAVVWVGSGMVLMGAALAGNLYGGWRVQDAAPAQVGRLFIVIVNLLCLYLAVGGLAWLLSSLSDRKGRAMTAVFVMVVASFLLSYLSQLWRPAEQVAFLSFMQYYRPLFVLRDGAWPWRDIGVLTGAAAVLWGAGGVVFSRRDLSTV
jgi:ABC-2 type transport system permease protein